MKSCCQCHRKKTSFRKRPFVSDHCFLDLDLNNTTDAAPQLAADKAMMESKVTSEDPVFGEITPLSLTTTVLPPQFPPPFVGQTALVVATGLSTAANAGIAENIIIAAAIAAANI